MKTIGYETMKFDSKGKFYVERVVDLLGNTKRVELSELSPPLLKEITFDIIVKNEYYSPKGEEKIYFGLQKCIAKIPEKGQFEYWYLSYVPKLMQSICLSVLDPNSLNRVTQTLDMNPESEFGKFVKKVGTSKKLTLNEARAMLRNKEVLGVFNDSLSQQTV